ncbi:conserved membrane hypothetical protein [Candidatus Sulfopaludibacter sp. SbA3]|nr:conserved membrane hypothetical protein [Candidatus Sulfopaludibacter sp. SbA3]
MWLGQYDPINKRDYVWKPDYLDWRTQAHSYTAMAAFGYQPAVIATSRGTDQITGVYVAGDFWKMTGAQAASGRLFGDEQDCLVLSWDYFQREFAGDARAIGQTVVLNARAARITGVLPRDFRFQLPMWWAAEHPEPVEAYLSVPRPGEGLAQSTQVVAALKPGIGIGQAQAELRALEAHLIAARGGETHGMTNLHIASLAEQLAGGARRALLVLLAAGAFVLLIATVNVANLLLARATLRQKEVAIRAAVGAGRARVMRQLLAESVLQAQVGGMTGLLLARWAIFILVRISPNAIPRLSETALDARVLAFTLAVSVLAGVVFGAVPAISLRRSNLNDSLKSGMRNSSGPGGLRLRRMLVGVELALAIVLLTGAGLMLKSYARMNAHPPGFDPESVIVMKVRFTGRQYLEEPVQRAYVRDLMGKLEGVPGVRAAGLSCWIFGRGLAFPFHLNAVSPGYLQALGMTLQKGRWLTESDTRGVLLNESMARQVFGGVDPIGRQLSMPRPRTVVGIVADLKYSKLDAGPPPEAFIGIGQAPDLYGVEIAARVTNPTALIPVLRKVVANIDPSQRVYDVKTMEEALSQSIAPRRFNLFLLGGFAAAALLLAVVGIYGVTAYSVAERTREIGMRMALGARRGQVAAMVVREAMPVASAGIGAGLAAAWGLSRVMTSLLYDVQATDTGTFVVVAMLLGVTALAACVGPAVRAASIDPTVALRYE